MIITHHPPIWLRYGIPITTVGFLASLHDVFPWLTIHTSYILFVPTVMVSAWFGGLIPGLLAIALSIFAGLYFFPEPTMSLMDEGRVIIFIAVGLSITLVITQLRNARNTAEEKEALLRESEKRLMEEAVQKEKLEASLKVALAKAEQANKAKSEFLANVSHEIRTPMNAVVGIANILGMQRPIPDHKHQELIRTLQLSAESLMELLNNLLDITKIENTHLQLENTAFNLKKLVQDVVAILSVKAHEKNIALILDYHPDIPDNITGDSNRLRQILMNLIGNAVKFTEKGSVTVKLYPCRNEHTDKRDLCIGVTDSGIGIPTDKLDSIFDKFSQADTSITRKYGGTGLGLPITKMLVELMWGKISVTSTPDQGSTFSVAIPMNIATGLQPDVRIREKSQTPAKKLFVLLVEDYPPNILVETSILEHLGYRYEVAQTGQEAIAKLQQNRFDLILMDIQMPVMDGYETVRQIRALQKKKALPLIPIIGVTAYALSDDRTKCLEAGMDDYIAKPFNPDELVYKINTLTGKSGFPAAA